MSDYVTECGTLNGGIILDQLDLLAIVSTHMQVLLD